MVTPLTLPEYEYKMKTNKRAIDNLSTFTFVQEVLEMSSMFMDIQLSSVFKKKQ
jgi:hypothetical protein